MPLAPNSTQSPASILAGLTASAPLVSSNGNVALGTAAAPTTADATADAVIGASATTKTALVLQSKASSTVPVFEIQNSAGAVKAVIQNDTLPGGRGYAQFPPFLGGGFSMWDADTAALIIVEPNAPNVGAANRTILIPEMSADRFWGLFASALGFPKLATEVAGFASGVATLNGGTPGTVTVALTTVTANTRFFLSYGAKSATTFGVLEVSSRNNGQDFTITAFASVSDASPVYWMAIEP